ncbi:MAG TPA: nuclear transport factor 2 family protein [Bryobacteraceae bacterium]|nr:nuclear transport factor 2 family protein [Bryobacteraceae bacterium]
MHRTLVALCLVAFSHAQTSGSAQTAVLATVHQFVDGFNQGDTKTLLAACADQTSILDEFPPHEWHGSGACAKWASEFDADAKKNGITDAVVTLRNPSHVDVTADRAYVVIPANYTFKQKGKPVSEVGSIITLASKRANPVGESPDGHGQNIRRGQVA